MTFRLQNYPSLDEPGSGDEPAVVTAILNEWPGQFPGSAAPSRKNVYYQVTKQRTHKTLQNRSLHLTFLITLVLSVHSAIYIKAKGTTQEGLDGGKGRGGTAKLHPGVYVPTGCKALFGEEE